jgi:hypothetical protein
VPKDPTDGWSFTDQSELSLTLNGSWCDKMRAGDLKTVEVQYICPYI